MESYRQGATRKEAVGRPKRSTLARRLRTAQLLLQGNLYLSDPTHPRRGYLPGGSLSVTAMGEEKEGRRCSGADQRKGRHRRCSQSARADRVQTGAVDGRFPRPGHGGSVHPSIRAQAPVGSRETSPARQLKGLTLHHNNDLVLGFGGLLCPGQGLRTEAGIHHALFPRAGRERMVERLIHSFKEKHAWLHRHRDIREARTVLARYIDPSTFRSFARPWPTGRPDRCSSIRIPPTNIHKIILTIIWTSKTFKTIDEFCIFRCILGHY
jgi:hypothetical protein